MKVQKDGSFRSSHRASKQSTLTIEASDSSSLKIKTKKITPANSVNSTIKIVSHRGKVGIVFSTNKPKKKNKDNDYESSSSTSSNPLSTDSYFDEPDKFVGDKALTYIEN